MRRPWGDMDHPAASADASAHGPWAAGSTRSQLVDKRCNEAAESELRIQLEHSKLHWFIDWPIRAMLLLGAIGCAAWDREGRLEGSKALKTDRRF